MYSHRALDAANVTIRFGTATVARLEYQSRS